MISEKDIEEMEFSIFNKIYEPLLEDYTDKFIHTIKILNNDDLITYLAGQGKGRATCYRNEIEELISNIGSLEINARKELNMRLASLGLFSEGVENIYMILYPITSLKILMITIYGHHKMHLIYHILFQTMKIAMVLYCMLMQNLYRV